MESYYEQREQFNRNLLKNLPAEIKKQEERIIQKQLRVFVNIYRCFLIISICFSSASVYLAIYISQLNQYNLQSILIYVSVSLLIITSTTALFMNKITQKIRMWKFICIFNFLGGAGIFLISLTLVIVSILDGCCGVQFQIDGQQVVAMCSNIQNGQKCSAISTQQVINRIQNENFINQVCEVYTCTDNNVVIIKSAIIYWISIMNLFCYFMLSALLMYLFIRKIHKVDLEIKHIYKEYLYSQSSNISSYSRESTVQAISYN